MVPAEVGRFTKGEGFRGRRVDLPAALPGGQAAPRAVAGEWPSRAVGFKGRAWTGLLAR